MKVYAMLPIAKKSKLHLSTLYGDYFPRSGAAWLPNMKNNV